VAGCTAAARAECPQDTTAAAARGHAWPLLSCTVPRPGMVPLPLVPCRVHVAALAMARSLFATRANPAARRVEGVDLGSQWRLDTPPSRLSPFLGTREPCSGWPLLVRSTPCCRGCVYGPSISDDGMPHQLDCLLLS
jgi:hypothetical protein